ncbi:putative XRE-type DNA-binding protein [Jezberella montanilacus]|uniref:Putative XRE-type DNA-binding protein n=1 Tax=Jezberella montanilacus TaxID=323426 RepID=A0A2T0XQ52_9BURK|nr:helix-turn-helix transcriptional regulator [Jezberella montanilacus]PRZ01088.1 putative XRE-type DNA-binding protein [Jezberella montanilacus]
MPNRRQVKEGGPKNTPNAPRDLVPLSSLGHVGSGQLLNEFSDTSHDGSVKATLASRLNALLDESGLSQSAAAQLLGMPQPKVSAIRNYKLRGISLERLMQALLALNQQVEIVVKPGRKAGHCSIRVAA